MSEPQLRADAVDNIPCESERIGIALRAGVKVVERIERIGDRLHYLVI